MKLLLAVLIMIGMIVPPIWLYMRPGDYSPGLETLFNVFLVFVSIVLANLMAKDSAHREANAKWVPFARFACRNLLTNWGHLCTFRSQLSRMCTDVSSELSKPDAPHLKPLQSSLSARCQSGSDQLQSIANHLMDQVSNWETFIAQNCDGDECEVIAEEIDSYREHLESQISEQKETTCVPADTKQESTKPR